MHRLNVIFKNFGKKVIFILIILPFFGISYSKTGKQPYYPGQGELWKRGKPEAHGIIADKLDDAIKFALDNEYSGSRDLRIEILKSFSKEPYIDSRPDQKEADRQE